MSVSITFPASVAYPIDLFHLRRALVGGSISRAWVSFVQGGTRYAADATYEGSGANCTTWEPALAGATRVAVSIPSGARTGAQNATSFGDALTAAGVTGVVVVGDTVTVTPASGLLVGSPMVYDTETRGIWGMQRDAFGNATDANQNGNMGGTGSVHVTAPNGAGRILGAYIRAGGSANVRLGVADGPAYSTTPAAFSGGSEAVGVRGADDTSLVLALFSEPQTMSAAENKWISFRGAGGGDPTLRYRNFAATPVGNGDLTVGEQLLFSTTTSNPATAIYTAGAYTHGAEAGPYNIYSFVGFVYELEDGSGSYPGDGGIVTQIGSHNTATAGGPTATVAADMDSETFGFRHRIPWDCEVTDVTVSIAGWAADEDLGLAFYDWADLVAPTVLGATLLRGVGPFGTAGTGYQTHTLATPLSVSAGTVFGVHFTAGNLDGVTPTDTISVNYDPNPAGSDYWSTSWIDDGRTWNDMVPEGGDGYGVTAEYRTRSAFGGDMPEGDPDPAWPDPFDIDASDDHSTENLLRYRFGVQRDGLSAVETADPSAGVLTLTGVVCSWD